MLTATDRHLVRMATLMVALAFGASYAQPNRQVVLEVLNARFEPLRRGKNVVHVEVKNTSDQDQVFRTHIQTRSPEYGRNGVGWGTGFFKTVPANETVGTRFVFKIQGPLTDETYIRLTFSNPGPEDTFDEEAWNRAQGWRQSFEQTEHLACDLRWAEVDSDKDVAASREEANAVRKALHRIQACLKEGDYVEAWQRFTTDYQQVEFQSTDDDRFRRAMEPQRPIDAAFGWERGPFLGLEPVRVVRREGKLALLAKTEGQTWTLDFVDEDGQWKLDWIAGYTPLFLRWQNWEEYALPKMEKRSTEHFDVYFSEDSTAAQNIERVVAEKEEGYRQICNFLANDPQMRIRLILFEDMSRKHWATGHQGMGWAYGRTIVEVYNDSEQLDPFHETTHILMGPVGSPPALFIEGFAVYMSQRLGADALEDLSGGTATIGERTRQLREQGEWIDLDELICYTEIGSMDSRPPVAYPLAASFVEFLIDTYGKDKFLQVYSTLKNSNNPDVHAQNARALASIYGQSLEQLRDAWEETL